MAGLYNYEMVRLMAAEIVKNIGRDVLYTNRPNRKYPNTPENFRLFKIDPIKQFVLHTLRIAGNPNADLRIITDPKLGENLYGLFVNRGNQNYILVNETLNECWFRFTLLKELCSLYVDHYDKQDKLTRFDNYLSSLQNAFNEKVDFVGKPGLDEGDLDSETFSILLATELMIPVETRGITDSLISSKIPLNDVAKSLMVPEFILKLFYEKN
jgi:hypothetical protein